MCIRDSTSRSTSLYATTRSCTASRRATAAGPRSSASASIDRQIPSSQIFLPSSLVRPVDQSRFRSGTLETYTRAFGAPARN